MQPIITGFLLGIPKKNKLRVEELVKKNVEKYWMVETCWRQNLVVFPSLFWLLLVKYHVKSEKFAKVCCEHFLPPTTWPSAPGTADSLGVGSVHGASSAWNRSNQEDGDAGGWQKYQILQVGCSRCLAWIYHWFWWIFVGKIGRKLVQLLRGFQKNGGYPKMKCHWVGKMGQKTKIGLGQMP